MASRVGSAIARLLLVLLGIAVLAVAYLYTRMPKAATSRVEAALDVVGVSSGGSFAWIVRTRTGAALIDAGLEPNATAIVEELKKQGLAPKDVHTVLLTHGHQDHFGGAGVFTSAQVYVGARDAAFVRGQAEPSSTAAPLLKRFAPAPNRPKALTELQGGETLDVDGMQIKVIAVPGHTPGSVVYLREGLLFTGDSLFGKGAAAVAQPPSALSEDAGENERSLKPLLALPFTAIADGHTGVTADARQKLAKLLE